MDARTIYHLLKPQLKSMGENEKKSLSKLIMGEVNEDSKSRRRILTVKEAKEKIKLYRSVEIQRERQTAK